MTIEELYQWAIKNHIEHYDIKVLERDGSYTLNLDLSINDPEQTVEL